jgi:hypothetical protein
MSADGFQNPPPSGGGAFKLVTRNIKDFSGLGVQLVNPWEA